jgi:hypothetical protein
MPTWSFSRKNPFSRSNFIIKDGKIFIIDYEQSVPIPDTKGCINYDVVRFDDLDDFISSNKEKILDRLGGDEVKNLEEALENARESHFNLDLRPKRITRFVKLVKKR